MKSPAALLKFDFVINLKAAKALGQRNGGAALFCRPVIFTRETLASELSALHT